MTYAYDTDRAPATEVDDLDARLTAIAFNAVRETAVALGRDSQFTDNDTKTALTLRRILNNIAGISQDSFQPMELAVKNGGTVSPVIDKVYNMLDKGLTDEYVSRAQPAAETPHSKRASKQQVV